MFAAFLLAGAMTIVVALLGGMVMGVADLFFGPPASAQAMSAPQYWTLAALYAPTRLAPLVLNAAVGALLWPIMFTPAASIYEQLTRRAGSGVADVFG